MSRLNASAAPKQHALLPSLASVSNLSVRSTVGSRYVRLVLQTQRARWEIIAADGPASIFVTSNDCKRKQPARDIRCRISQFRCTQRKLFMLERGQATREERTHRERHAIFRSVESQSKIGENATGPGFGANDEEPGS